MSLKTLADRNKPQAGDAPRPARLSSSSTDKAAEKGQARRSVGLLDRMTRPLLTLAAAAALGVGATLLAASLEERARWLDPSWRAPDPYRSIDSVWAGRDSLGPEVGLRAQLDRPRAYFVRASEGEAFAAPLYPSDARQPSNPVRVVLLEPQGAPSEAVFANWVLAVGEVGTVVELFGRPVAPDAAVRERVAQALSIQGLALAQDALFFDPYGEARIAPDGPSPVTPIVAMTAMGVSALLALMAWWRRIPERHAPTPQRTKKGALLGERAPSSKRG